MVSWGQEGIANTKRQLRLAVHNAEVQNNIFESLLLVFKLPQDSGMSLRPDRCCLSQPAGNTALLCLVHGRRARQMFRKKQC